MHCQSNQVVCMPYLVFNENKLTATLTAQPINQ